MTHKTRGIVLRTVKFGESSVITTVYTELFGLQSYLVKGVRQAVKKASAKSVFFQPAAILDMVVYHNEHKQLNFIKEYNWGYLYENLLFDVVKNTVAIYMVELLQHSLKQPEANPELFYLMHDSLVQLDKGNGIMTANLPLYFSLHLASELGFAIQGTFGVATPILDMQEGQYVQEQPLHQFFVTADAARHTAELLSVHFYNELEALQLSRSMRQQLLIVFQNYISLHVPDFGEVKTLKVLQKIFE